MIDDGIGFQQLLWQLVLDRIGQHIGGVMRKIGDTEWSFGRQRVLDLSVLPRNYEGPRQHHLLVAMGLDRRHPARLTHIARARFAGPDVVRPGRSSPCM